MTSRTPKSSSMSTIGSNLDNSRKRRQLTMKNLDKRAVTSSNLIRMTPHGPQSEEHLPLLPDIETTAFGTTDIADDSPSAVMLFSGIGHHPGRDRTSSLTSEGSSQRSKDNDSGNSSLVDSGSSDSCHEFGGGSRSRTISSSKSDQNLTCESIPDSDSARTLEDDDGGGGSRSAGAMKPFPATRSECLSFRRWRIHERSGSLEEILPIRRLKAAFPERELHEARTFSRRRGKVMSEEGPAFFSLSDSTFQSQSCRHIYRSSGDSAASAAFDSSSPTYSDLRQKEWERTELFYKRARPACTQITRSLSAGNVFSQIDSDDGLSLEPGRPSVSGHSRCGSLNTGSGSSRCSIISSSYREEPSFIDPNLDARVSTGSLAWDRSDDSLASLSCRCSFSRQSVQLNDPVTFPRTFTAASHPGFSVSKNPAAVESMGVQPAALHLHQIHHLFKKSHVPKLESVLCFGTPLAYSSMKFNDGSSQTREDQPPLQVLVPRLCTSSSLLPPPRSQTTTTTTTSSSSTCIGSTATCQPFSPSATPILSEIPTSAELRYPTCENSSSSIHRDSPNGTPSPLFSHSSDIDIRVDPIPNQNTFTQLTQANLNEFTSTTTQNSLFSDSSHRHSSTNALCGFETRGDSYVDTLAPIGCRPPCYQRADLNPCGMMTTVDMNVCQDAVQPPGLTHGHTALGHPGGSQLPPQGGYTLSNSVANSNQSLTNSLESGHSGGRRRSQRHSSLTELLKNGRNKVSRPHIWWSREIPDYRFLCLAAAIFNPIFGAVAFILNYFAGHNFQLHRLNKANNLYLATIITSTSGIFISLIGLALLAAHSVVTSSHPAVQNSSHYLCHATDDRYIQFFGLSRSMYCELRDNDVVMEALKHYYLMDQRHRQRHNQQNLTDKQNTSLSSADQKPNSPPSSIMPHFQKIFYQNYSGGDLADDLMYHNTVKGSSDGPVIPPGLEKEMEIQKMQQTLMQSASITTQNPSAVPNSTQSVNE